MPLDFPASPATNQTYSGPGGVVWVWDGAKWVSGTGSTVYAPVTSPVFLGNPTAPNPPAGDADTSVATTSFVAAAVAPAFNDRGRNLLHNPLFNVAQRGAGPFAPVNASIPSLDRWIVTAVADTLSGSSVAANDATRAAVGDEQISQSFGINFTGTAGAGALSVVQQNIEGVRRLAGKTVTASFWASGSIANLHVGVSLDQYFGSGGSPSAAVNVNGQQTSALPTGGAWQRFAVTLTLPSSAGKTLGTNNNDYTALDLWLSSGATNNVRAGSIGVQSGSVYIWGVQLEIGSVATPLEKPDPRYDLANCQRFYCIGVGSSAGSTTGALYVASFCSFPVTMRAVPTVAIVGGAVGTDTNVASTGFDTVGSTGLRVYFQATATGYLTGGRNWTASADL